MRQRGSERSDFRNTLGSDWDSQLTSLLAKHKHLRCLTCGGVYSAAPQMHEFLADVEHLYVNFNPNGKGSKYFNWLNRQTAGTGNAADIATNNANTSLAEMYHTINQLRLKGLKEGDISQLGANYSTLPNSRQSDILLTDGTHIELKNKKYTKGTTPTAQEIDQVIGEKGALGNIDNLNKFEWQSAVWRGNNITEVKTMWKNVFDTRKTEIFEAMSDNLKSSLQLDDELDLTSSKIDEIVNAIIKVE